MYSLSRGAIKLLEMNVTLLGVDPLKTVKLRRNLPDCPALSSSIVLLEDLEKLQLFCSICEKCKFVKKHLPVQQIYFSLCPAFTLDKVSVGSGQKTVPWIWLMEGVGSGKLSALWRVMWQHSGGEQRLSSGSYKDKVSVHPWTL